MDSPTGQEILCFPGDMRTCIVELKKELVEPRGICSQAAPFLTGFVQETDEVIRVSCLVRRSVPWIWNFLLEVAITETRVFLFVIEESRMTVGRFSLTATRALLAA